jgi:hypothetical protein
MAMARVKFLVFALAVLGLWAAHLYLLSPALGTSALELARDRAALLPHAVTLQVQERRFDLQRAALSIAATPQALAVLHPVRGKVEAPTPEKLADFRALVAAALPEELRQAGVLVLVNDSGSVASRGAEALDVAGLDLGALTQAGADGVARDVAGEAHAFHSLPVMVEGKQVGTVVVGAPLVSAQLLERAVAQSGAAALGLWRDGKVLHAAGPQKDALVASAEKIGAGHPEVVIRGEVSALGPLKLPVLTAKDNFGGQSAQWLGGRHPLPATPFEVLTLSSAGPVLLTLADYQRLAIFAFLGLLGLSAVFVLVIGAGRAAPGKEAVPRAVAAAKNAAPAAVAAAAPAPVDEADGASSDPSGLPDLPPVPEASPDDFPFGQPAADPQPEAAPEPYDAPPPFAQGLFENAQPMASNASPAEDDESPTGAHPPPPPVDYSQDADATAAYPSSVDPFAMAAGQGQAYGEDDHNDNPEATRVAAIPAELLQQSAQSSEPTSAPAMRAHSFAPPPVAAPVQAAGSDDGHFLEVFQAFVQTREQCGEAADGLTFDKFAQKLRKNREQLVTKYQCRTVRFQVYVKEGKAALKATPVKD